MNGEIGLDSVEGSGSRAWFAIPFAKAPTPASGSGGSMGTNAVESTGPSIGASSNPLKRPRKDVWIVSLLFFRSGWAFEPDNVPVKLVLICARFAFEQLVAEDNLINQQIALKTLKKMGFSSKAANNGLEVLSEMSKTSYDLILMDCQVS